MTARPRTQSPATAVHPFRSSQHAPVKGRTRAPMGFPEATGGGRSPGAGSGAPTAGSKRIP
eukprot:6439601-Alexandrium_andersonii.AAC.1